MQLRIIGESRPVRDAEREHRSGWISRGADVGDFVYHCHIAEHEDHGIMAIIRVLPGVRSWR